MTQVIDFSKSHLNKNVSYDVTHTTDTQQPVIIVQERKLVSHRLVALLFQIDPDYLSRLFHTHAKCAGCSDDVYVDEEGAVLYVNGMALVAVMKVLPDEFNLTGMGYLSVLLQDDPAMTEIQADFIREMRGAGSVLS